MEHHFEIADAEKYGIAKAVLLYNLRFWLRKNKANRNHIHTKDGVDYYWTYNSARALQDLFPYMSEDSIQRNLRSLEADGVVICGNFNATKYDQTKWYTLPEFRAVETAEVSLRTRESAEPIPDINTDNPDRGEIRISHPPLFKSLKRPPRTFGGYNESAASDAYEPAIDADTGEMVAPPPKPTKQTPKPRADDPVWEMIRWAENQRGGSFMSYPKQIKALGQLRDAKVSRESIKARWRDMQNDKFWQDKGFDFINVLNSFDKKPQ